MAIPGVRVLNLAGFLVCAGLIGFALYAQHGLLLEPCPLCVLQRFAVIGVGIVFLVAAIHNPASSFRFAYAGLLALVAALGLTVAGRHVWLQNMPADQVPACGPGLDYLWETFPLADVIDMVFRGSGECATVDWTLLGLSMPAWVLIALLGLGSAGVWNNVRRERGASSP